MPLSTSAIAQKYQKKLPISNLPDRQWPSNSLDKAPIWLSTDLRDGNQALPSPMNFEQKWEFFELLLAMRFKQIEISFPCASETEFAFTRSVADSSGVVPDDVTLEVIAPCRKETLARAVESIRGARNVIIFTFLATSDNYQETIFEASEETLLERARICVEYLRSITKDDPYASSQTNWSFGFGFEDFGNSRPEVALRLAETVKAVWRPTADNPIILGLATSVESYTPNVYADQVEYFSRNISNRDTVCISLHTHNDRGCAVASAELGALAGADRVEGCLFGNGERAGNLDLVTMGLNYLTQGIDPGLDFSLLPHARQIYEEITGLPIHPRAPYAGDYYFRAFSGSHQDAIRKGLKKYSAAQTESNLQPAWSIPYLPLDPADIGLTFDCVIGINSQSGKSGVSWVLRQGLQLNIPDALASVFSKCVKVESERVNRTLTEREVCDLFLRTYSVGEVDSHIWVRQMKGAQLSMNLDIFVGRSVGDITLHISQVLGRDVHPVQSHGDQVISDAARKVTFVECRLDGASLGWGVGIGVDGMENARAIISALASTGLINAETGLPSPQSPTPAPLDSSEILS
ncbi:2-isopropylmalalate synthase [Penicillium herquei]|nr:2-isopropylmalalate synthase [Penicillium herquei]